jgi:hypothetical protein
MRNPVERLGLRGCRNERQRDQQAVEHKSQSCQHLISSRLKMIRPLFRLQPDCVFCQRRSDASEHPLFRRMASLHLQM